MIDRKPPAPADVGAAESGAIQDRKPPLLEDNSDKYTIFPVGLLKDTIGILKERGAEFTTYKQLSFGGAFDYAALHYLSEYASFKRGRRDVFSIALAVLERQIMIGRPRFLAALKPLMRARHPLTVILQHDADRLPGKTQAVMELEKEMGVISSNFFFVNDAYDDGDQYDLDIPVLQALERTGFEIGYHLNAYELSEYDAARAQEIAERDVAWFREHFDLRTYVPHSGNKSDAGLNNEHFPQSGILKELIWAYNRRGILNDFGWSDGAAGLWATPGDPREFARSVPDGARIFMLMHPQYYGETLCQGWEDLPISKCDWWRKVWQL